MPILKTILTGNGLTAAARVEQVTAQRTPTPIDGWAVQMGLYPDVDAAREGRGLLWQLYPIIPFDAVDPSDVFGSIEQYLTTAEGDFNGGMYVPAVVTDTLDDAKQKKWAQIKADRVRAEDAGFEVEGLGKFQSDNDSRQKIVGASLAAKIAKDEDAPYSVDWTLADNSVVTLNADQMILVGQMLLVHLDAVHQESRRLYQLVQDATDVETVNRIRWGVTDAELNPTPPPEEPQPEEAP